MNSSSGESTAPLDFHISSSSDDNCKLGIYPEDTEDCPLCLKPSRNFYCRTCINHGEFCPSSRVPAEKFSDLKMRFLLLMKEKLITEKACEKALAMKVKATALLGEIEIVSERNNLLRTLLENTKKNISEKEKNCSEMKLDNSTRSIRLLKYRDRVERLKRYVDEKHFERREMIDRLVREQEELKHKRRINIKQLVTYIFPISVVEPSQKQEVHSTISALEEACQTAFIQGKWISPISSFERQHRIVAPTLPASGDYSAYNDWVAANRECVPSSSNSTSVDFNPAYNISAALTYTTQLVNMLAYFLDVRLPAKLCYSDFCTHEMSRNKFTKKVARLNWNVLHLCLSQNVDPRLLKPERTLSNLVLLLDQTVSDLGRSSTPDIKPEESRVLEDALRPDLEKDDPDDSGDEGLSYDWEAVPTSNGLPESEPIQNFQSQQISSTSVAGGLITSTAASIVSLLRWNR
ncbi:beclin 1-associated autophagy-related key regulator [Halyomorpha halys]|uniref:beclin 1-associated autophagy-related key regulator n=1 Tax=Halyomorpha halys TaxID=286706 RepID=UPI0006D526A3|nr:beclin 1-associated autophagy-related key regulator [Halyomorpha halys]